jgi:peptide/nickel transport system substrate-binding protein
MGFRRLLALALLSLMLMASGSPRAQRLVIAQTWEPIALDPLLLTDAPAEQIGGLLFSYLVRIDARGRLVPDLASRVPSLANGDIAADQCSIVYHLRRDVRWHDGARFTARDVIATYRAVMDARNPVPTRLGYDRIVALETPDDATLRVRLRKPFAPFLTYFFEPESYPVLPAHIVTRTPDLRSSSLSTVPVGTGPYRFVRWDRGNELVLAANPAYYGGAPRIAELTIRFVSNVQSIATELETGEADAYLGADPALVARIRSNPRVRMTPLPIYGFTSLTFQTRDPALRDARVRAAVAATFALERDVARASYGALTTRGAMRALFTWATIPVVRSTAAGPLPAHLTLAIDASRALDRNVAVALQDDARRAGFTLEIIPYAPQFLLAPAVQHGPIESGRFQLAMHAVLTGADPETSWLLACDQIPPKGFNVSRWCDRAVDRALAEALTTVDQTTRRRDYAIVQRAVARDVPFVALWQNREIEVLPAGMSGFSGSPETAYFGVERWQR